LRRIEPRRTLITDTLAELFPGSESYGSQYVRATADSGVLPFEIIRGPAGSMQILGGLADSEGSAILYSPQYAVGGSWRTTLSLVNLTNEKGTVSLRFFSREGVELAERIEAVAERGKVEISDQTYFASGAATPLEGYLVIESGNVRLAGQVTFGDSGQQAFATALPLTSELEASALFSQLASDSTYYTGLAILNPHDSILNATLAIYNSGGTRVAAGTVSLGPRQKSSGLLSEFFPDLGNLSSGYLTVEADQVFAGYVVFGTHSMTALSAVPPQEPGRVGDSPARQAGQKPPLLTPEGRTGWLRLSHPGGTR
jgi:hypothetical protein